MIFGKRAYAILSTARIANIPSVVSNLGVGVPLGTIAGGEGLSWPWLLSLAAILLYVGGNFLNDWADRDWDKLHRPERALPNGMFSGKSYLFTALVCFGAGLATAILYGWLAITVSVALVWFIVYYTEIHKKTSLSVIPMGMCRACLPLLGYVAVSGSISGPAFFPSAALLIYIIALSMSARGESRSDVQPAEKWQARGLLFAGGILAAILPLVIEPTFGWIGLIPFLIWLALCITKFRTPIPVHVSALLAGIPLVDWVILLPMAFIWVHLERFILSDPMCLTAILLPPLAFISGRLLQRIAPAT